MNPALLEYGRQKNKDILTTSITKELLELACKPYFNLFFAIITLNVMRYLVESECLLIYSLNIHVIIILCFFFPHLLDDIEQK